MKKILIYFNSMQPAGGIERVIATLSDKFAFNYKITILVKDEPRSFFVLNEKVIIHSLYNELKFNMDSKLSRVFSAIRTVVSNTSKLRKYLRKHDYDFYYLAHPLNVLEFNLAGANHERMIITEHGARSAYNPMYRLLKKMLYKKCKVYIVPTKTDVESYKFDGFPAKYIPHFRSNLPYSLAKKANKIVLNIGRFTADKQQLLLLEIWAEIIAKKAAVGWLLHIVGTGELREEMDIFIQERSLETHVKILSPSPMIEEYYLNASIFTLTSRSEGFGMVLLEAISFGLPCVSFDCPSGPKDIVMNEINGFLIDLGDREAYKNKLLSLINDQGLVDSMGRKAYENSAEWSDEIILNKWMEVLK